jgi:hypothetical protein
MYPGCTDCRAWRLHRHVEALPFEALKVVLDTCSFSQASHVSERMEKSKKCSFRWH